MSEIIDANVSTRICNHMNKDHSDSLIFYAKEYGQISEVTSAKMISIDSEGMNLSVKVNDQDQDLRINFDHTLESAQDAHHTLVEMLKKTP